MKKIRTYGKKRSKREVLVNITDRFDEVSDDSDIQRTSSKWGEAFSAYGWCQPKKENLTKEPEVQFVDYEKGLKSYGMVASTPCSTAVAKVKEALFDESDIRFDGSETEFSDIIADDLKNLSLRNELSSVLIESKVHQISDALIEDSRYLDNEKDALPLSKSNEGHFPIPISNDLSVTQITNDRNEVTFLEALTPYRLQLDENAKKTTFMLDESFTIENKLLALCGQQKILDINDFFQTRKVSRKVGEGVYGEVFEAEGPQGNVAIKIVPVNGSTPVNGETQKTFSEILPEIAISKELTSLSTKNTEGHQVNGFIKFFSVSCCKGCYPECLLEQWEVWNVERESENDNPKCFDDDQIYIIFEIELGGSTLEEHRSVTTPEARSILHQIVAALAVGEKAVKFEHRDLHWGNVLIKETGQRSFSYLINDTPEKINSAGLEIGIIDFTLSRLEKDGCIVFCNLAEDETLFNGQGDYQFDVYRKMQEENGNCWSTFNPKSNVFWVHYLTEKIINEKLKRKSSKLNKFFERILEYHSAVDILFDKFFKE